MRLDCKKTGGGPECAPASLLIPSHSMKKSPVTADRIGLSEALIDLEPFMGKSTFYGSAAIPGPRWTMVERLEIRCGKRVTLDRAKFFRWLKELSGELAVNRHSSSRRLGMSQNRKVDTRRSYGSAVLELCQALNDEKITREQFDQALINLDPD